MGGADDTDTRRTRASRGSELEAVHQTRSVATMPASACPPNVQMSSLPRAGMGRPRIRSGREVGNLTSDDRDEEHTRDVAAPLKDSFGPDVPARIGRTISAVHPGFPAEAFLGDALEGYEALELTPRARHIAR